MTKESKVYDASGNLSYIRDVSDDGRSSELYTVRTGLSALIFGERKDRVEIADHNLDGTTTAYEASDSFWDRTFHGGRGREKPVESDEDDYSCLLDEDGELSEEVCEIIRGAVKEANRQLAEERESPSVYVDRRSYQEKIADCKASVARYWPTIEDYKKRTAKSLDHIIIDQMYSLPLEELKRLQTDPPLPNGKTDTQRRWHKSMLIEIFRDYKKEDLGVLLHITVDDYILPKNREDDKTYIMCKKAEELRNELRI